MCTLSLQGGLGAPAQAEGGPGGLGAVGRQGQVARDHHLLPQLAVHGQLGVEAVALQVEDQHPVGGGNHRKIRPFLDGKAL